MWTHIQTHSNVQANCILKAFTQTHERKQTYKTARHDQKKEKRHQTLIKLHMIITLCFLCDCATLHVVILPWTVHHRKQGKKITVQQMIPCGKPGIMRAVWLISTFTGVCYSLTEVQSSYHTHKYTHHIHTETYRYIQWSLHEHTCEGEPTSGLKLY